MKGDTGKTDSAPAFVLCPPACADAVRRALPPGCDLVVAGSPEEARAAFAERTRLPEESGAGEVEIDGRSVDLTTLERAVFEVLSRTPGRTVSRAALLREIHGDAAGSVLPRVVDSTVSRLRRKLGPSGWRVETVWGRGYRWNAGVGPSSSPFATAFRWSAGTLGVFVLTAILVARPPRPDDGAGGAPSAAEPTVAGSAEESDPAPVAEPVPDPAAQEPDLVAEPSAASGTFEKPPAPAAAPVRPVARKAAAAPAHSAAPAPVAASVSCAASAPAVEPAFVEVPSSPLDPLPPKAGFDVHVFTAEDRTLSNLARARGITLAELLAANPQIADPDLVRVGQLVYVPASGAATDR